MIRDYNRALVLRKAQAQAELKNPRTMDYELWTMDYELWTMNYGL